MLNIRKSRTTLANARMSIGSGTEPFKFSKQFELIIERGKSKLNVIPGMMATAGIPDESSLFTPINNQNQKYNN